MIKKEEFHPINNNASQSQKEREREFDADLPGLKIDIAERSVRSGRPEEAKKFFDVNTLEEIVRKVSRKAEGGEGLTDIYMERYRQMQDGGRLS